MEQPSILNRSMLLAASTTIGVSPARVAMKYTNRKSLLRQRTQFTTLGKVYLMRSGFSRHPGVEGCGSFFCAVCLLEHAKNKIFYHWRACLQLRTAELRKKMNGT